MSVLSNKSRYVLHFSAFKILQIPIASISIFSQKHNKLKAAIPKPEISKDIFKAFKPGVLQILEERQFICSGTQNQNTTWGLLGVELVNNCKSEWTRHILDNYNANVEIKQVPEKDDKILSLDKNQDVSIQILQQFLQDYKKNEKIPKAVSFNFLQNFITNKKHQFEKDELVLGIFMKKNSDFDLESFHSDCLKWLKKYLRKPAMLISAGEKSSKDNKICETGSYKYEDNSFRVFKSVLMEANDLEKCSDWNNVKKMFDYTPNLLMVRICVNNLLASIFADSHHIVQFDNYHHEMMCIHPFLAPVKTAVQINSTNSENIEKLTQLADELCLYTRNMGVTCWNAHQMELTNNDLDTSGVPYTLIVSDQTLDNGLMHVRSRDTSLEMEMHITHVNEKLFLYLQPR